MLSKLFMKNVMQTRKLTWLSQRAFAASSHKKPSIGDAVTILQSKVSNINQVVSPHHSMLMLSCCFDPPFFDSSIMLLTQILTRFCDVIE